MERGWGSEMSPAHRIVHEQNMSTRNKSHQTWKSSKPNENIFRKKNNNSYAIMEGTVLIEWKSSETNCGDVS